MNDIDQHRSLFLVSPEACLVIYMGCTCFVIRKHCPTQLLIEDANHDLVGVEDFAFVGCQLVRYVG